MFRRSMDPRHKGEGTGLNWKTDVLYRRPKEPSAIVAGFFIAGACDELTLKLFLGRPNL